MTAIYKNIVVKSTMILTPDTNIRGTKLFYEYIPCGICIQNFYYSERDTVPPVPQKILIRIYKPQNIQMWFVVLEQKHLYS